MRLIFLIILFILPSVYASQIGYISRTDAVNWTCPNSFVPLSETECFAKHNDCIVMELGPCQSMTLGSDIDYNGVLRDMFYTDYSKSLYYVGIEQAVQTPYSTADVTAPASVGTNTIGVFANSFGTRLANTAYTVPLTSGTPGQVLKLDDANNLIWGEAATLLTPPVTVTNSVALWGDGQGDSLISTPYTFPLVSCAANETLVSDGTNFICSPVGTPAADVFFANTIGGLSAVNTSVPYFVNTTETMTLNLCGTMTNNITEGVYFTATKSCRISGYVNISGSNPGYFGFIVNPTPAELLGSFEAAPISKKICTARWEGNINSTAGCTFSVQMSPNDKIYLLAFPTVIFGLPNQAVIQISGNGSFYSASSPYVTSTNPVMNGAIVVYDGTSGEAITQGPISLPPSAGLDGQMLASNGLGSTYWVSPSGTVINDTLTSTSASEALSANMGRVLDQKIIANAASIASNTSAIADNTTNINSNTVAIADNAADIAANEADIASNTVAIQDNAAAIASNTAAIEALKIPVIQWSATGVTGYSTNNLSVPYFTTVGPTNNMDSTNCADVINTSDDGLHIVFTKSMLFKATITSPQMITSYHSGFTLNPTDAEKDMAVNSVPQDKIKCDNLILGVSGFKSSCFFTDHFNPGDEIYVQLDPSVPIINNSEFIIDMSCAL